MKMRFINCALFVTLWLSSTAGVFSSGATAQTPGLNLVEVHFSDPMHGWILSHTANETFVFRTIDSGKTWQAKSESDLLIKLRFANAQLGWAVGAKGTIVLTSDGGHTWQAQKSGSTETLYDLFILDCTHVWVSGNKGTLLSTDDGGKHWLTHNVGLDIALSGVTFVGRNGWAIGYGAIFSTTDGGQTWTTQGSGEWKQLSSIALANNYVGWITTAGSSILRTLDGGTTWQELVVPGAGKASISFIDPQNGWAALSRGGSTGSSKGPNTLYPESSVLVTQDGGNTWEKIYHLKSRRNFTSWISDIFFLNRANGWAVGGDGLYLRTVDGGRHWEESYLSQKSSQTIQGAKRAPNPLIVGLGRLRLLAAETQSIQREL